MEFLLPEELCRSSQTLESTTSRNHWDTLNCSREKPLQIAFIALSENAASIGPCG